VKARLPYLAGGLLALNLAFFGLVIVPARQALRVHAATFQDLYARMASLRREQREQEILASLLKGMEQFRNRIPPQGAIPAMIRRVTDQARRLQLYVPSVKYQPGDVAEEELVKLTVQMEVEGGYGAIRRFLYEVEGLQDPLIVERVALSSARGIDRLNLRLEMAAYFLPEQRISKPVLVKEEHVKESRSLVER
jgi:Tfp pilus assembly protein PilO